MIKVITLDSSSWNKGLFLSKDKDKTKDERPYVYESEILEQFLNDGWDIIDFIMSSTSSHTKWTFILKNDNVSNDYHLINKRTDKWN